MKKIILIVFLVVALLILPAIAGCGGGSASSQELSREKYDQISSGMTTEQLKSIAGEPAKTESSSMSGGHSMGGSMMTTKMTIEYWYYQGSRGWVRLTMSDGKVSAKSGY